MSLIRINKNPTDRQLKVFGLVWLVFFGLSGWESWFRGRHGAAEAIWALAAVVPLAGQFVPGFLRVAYLAMSYLTYPVGFVVSHVVLAFIYYLAIAPIGLTMRLFSYDPLCRRIDANATSYWRPRSGTKTPEDYFRQS
jgi:hypothetical protein